MSDATKPKKAQSLDDLLTQEYGVNTHPGTETGVKAVQTTVTQLCSNNPNRVGLTFLNLGAASVFIYIDNTVGVGKGLLVSANGGSVALDWRTDFTLISNDWYGISPGGPSNLQVIELVTL
jgi:hypothetical protein